MNFVLAIPTMSKISQKNIGDGDFQGFRKASLIENINKLYFQ